MSLRRRSGGYPWEGFDIFLNRVMRGSERPRVAVTALSPFVLSLSGLRSDKLRTNGRERMNQVVDP